MISFYRVYSVKNVEEKKQTIILRWNLNLKVVINEVNIEQEKDYMNTREEESAKCDF